MLKASEELNGINISLWKVQGCSSPGLTYLVGLKLRICYQFIVEYIKYFARCSSEVLKVIKWYSRCKQKSKYSCVSAIWEFILIYNRIQLSELYTSTVFRYIITVDMVDIVLSISLHLLYLVAVTTICIAEISF